LDLRRRKAGDRRCPTAALGGAEGRDQQFPRRRLKSPKRKSSPEGRQAIVDALKRRWAAKRAAASAKKPATKAISKAVKVKAAGGGE
jgi:hypothetical protein